MARAKDKESDVLDVINNPDSRKKFKTTLATITHYMQMIDDQKEGIKETVADLAANTGLDKKLIRKIATTMYKHNYADIQEENNHFETLYEMLIEGKINAPSNPVDADDTESE